MTEKPWLVGEPWKQKVYKVLNWLSRITVVGRLFSSFSLFAFIFCYFGNCSTWTLGTVRHLAELILFTLKFENSLKIYLP